MDDFDGASAPKAGRRAGRRLATTVEVTLNDDGEPAMPSPNGTPTVADEGAFSESKSAFMEDSTPSPAPAPAQPDEGGPPAARSGAFSLEDTTSDSAESKKFLGISRRKQEQNEKGDEDEKIGRKKKYDDVESIVEIPEVDDAGEDITHVIAEAPKIRSQKIQAINELQDSMGFNLPASDDRDIDLSLLTAVLCSVEQIQDGDDLWDADHLFTDVASELNAEREKAEGGPAPSNEPMDDMNQPDGMPIT